MMLNNNYLRKQRVSSLLGFLVFILILSSFGFASSHASGPLQVGKANRVTQEQEGPEEPILNPLSVSSVDFEKEYNLPIYDNLLDMVQVGDYIYGSLNDYNGLIIFDISDITNVQYSNFLINATSCPAIVSDGSYLYVSNYSSGVLVYDLVDPLQPSLVGTWTNGTEILRIAKQGDYLYLLDRYGFVVVDVSDPTNPTDVSRFNSTGNNDFQFLTVRNDFAYVLETDTVIILNITDHQNIVSPWEDATTETFYDILIYGQVLFVAASDTLFYYNVSNPTSPTIIDNYVYGFSNGRQLSRNNDIMFLSDTQDKIIVLDISNITAVSELYSADTEGFVLKYTIVLDADHLFCAGLYAAGILDISATVDAEFVWFDVFTNTPSAIARQGNYLYWSYPWRLAITDISDVNNPKLVYSLCNSSYFITKIILAYGHLYLLDSSQYLRIFDLSNPIEPTFVSEFFLSGFPYDLFVTNEYAYVSYFNSIQIIDIYYPDAPQPIYAFPTGITPDRLTVVGDYLFFDIGKIVYIYEMITPFEIEEAGNYTSNYNIIDFLIKGSYLYTIVNNGIEIVDISDYSDTHKIGQYLFSSGQDPQFITVENSYLYMYSPGYGVDILSLANMAHPKIIGKYKYIGGCAGMVVSGGKITLATTDGILGLATKPLLTGASPALSFLGVFIALTILTGCFATYKRKRKRNLA